MLTVNQYKHKEALLKHNNMAFKNWFVSIDGESNLG